MLVFNTVEGLHSWALRYLCLTSMGTLPGCRIRTTVLCSALSISEELCTYPLTHFSLLQGWCHGCDTKCPYSSIWWTAAKQCASHMLSWQCWFLGEGRFYWHGTSTWMFRQHRRLSFCLGSVMLVSYFLFVLLWHPIKGQGSWELCVLKTWVCVAKRKNPCSNQTALDTPGWINQLTGLLCKQAR